MAEEVRCSGKVRGDLNATFLVLIPKKEKATSFNDYRLISLYITLYKIVSKTIVDRLKGVLSDHISTKQLGFLKNRSIHDVVETTQEVIHTIHTQKLQAMVMKIDLSKAYNMVDWGLLRMILFKVGLDRASVNWTMGCVTNTSMTIIINGVASRFFKPRKGLIQGCVLSPLLFILVMDSLSLKIKSVVRRGYINGIKLSHSR